MYNTSGKYVKALGIPTKSGVSGNLLSVVPGIGSIASWCPKLNAENNTVKGIGMVKKMGQIYNNFNLFHYSHEKKDLTWRAYHKEIKFINVACESAAKGDLETLVRLKNLMANLNNGDYDNRTPMHLAAATGHMEIIKFLLEKCNCDPTIKDRWGSSPLAEALTDEVKAYLRKGNPNLETLESQIYEPV